MQSPIDMTTLLKDLVPMVKGLKFKDIQDLENKAYQVDPDSPQGLEYLSQVALIKQVYFDNYRLKKNIPFRGWNYTFNPFETIELLPVEALQPSLLPDYVESTLYDAISRGHGYTYIGLWTNAEEYFQLALHIAYVTNNVLAMLQMALHLSECYLFGNDNVDALEVSRQALPIAVRAENWLTISRLFTVLVMATFRSDQSVLIERYVKTYGRSALDNRIDEKAKEIYTVISNRSEFMKWETDWNKLSILVASAASP